MFRSRSARIGLRALVYQATAGLHVPGWDLELKTARQRFTCYRAQREEKEKGEKKKRKEGRIRPTTRTTSADREDVGFN